VARNEKEIFCNLMPLSPMTLKNLRKDTVDGKEIMIVDFSDLNENEMIQLVSESRARLLEEKRLQRLLVILNEKNFVTSRVMRHVETEKKEALAYSLKQAIVGLSKPQRMILKGYNVIFKRDVRVFETQEQAIKYLIE
jgi:hypothetical protein